MLHDAGLSIKYCAFAVPVAVYPTNWTPTQAVVGNTSYAAGHRRKPILKHLRVLGCLAFVHIPNEKQKKLDYRATPGIFNGYGISTKQYFIYDPLAMTLLRSSD